MDNDSIYEEIAERLYVISLIHDLDFDELFNEFSQFIAENIGLSKKNTEGEGTND